MSHSPILRYSRHLGGNTHSPSPVIPILPSSVPFAPSSGCSDVTILSKIADNLKKNVNLYLYDLGLALQSMTECATNRLCAKGSSVKRYIAWIWLLVVKSHLVCGKGLTNSDWLSCKRNSTEINLVARLRLFMFCARGIWCQILNSVRLGFFSCLVTLYVQIFSDQR